MANDLIVKDNRLIQAKYNLTKTQIKFIAFMASSIKKDDIVFFTYSIKLNEILEKLDIDSCLIHSSCIHGHVDDPFNAITLLSDAYHHSRQVFCCAILPSFQVVYFYAVPILYLLPVREEIKKTINKV